MNNRAVVGTLLLAAGQSARMGRPKQLLPAGPVSLVRRSAERVIELNAGPVVVVVGASASEISRELTGLDLTLAYNSDWAQGPGSSVKKGMETLTRRTPRCERILIHLADLPRVTTEDLRRLLEAAPHALITAASFGHNVGGAPAIFGQSLFAELLSLSPDTGAQSLIRRYASQVHRCPLPNATQDIDTWADYQSFLKEELPCLDSRSSIC